ncbi:calcium-binding protein [Phenylobacterium sp.]|uniref:calcium-binding protein n=1 Tax=Phenylobacterium sp. TaxID=1871053 RepID=UPI002727222F|nr:calcium-binding protein [Phenylobacterium sp.]MDO8378318.1 calcium-binding protein [Phenylobacterium sp.]
MSYSITIATALPLSLRETAIRLQPAPDVSGPWDLSAAFRPQSNIGASDIFAIELSAGSKIEILNENLSLRPGGLVLYDQNGASLAQSYQSSVQDLSGFVAPYTGLYFINALWSPNTTPGWAQIRVRVDLPGAITEGDDDLAGRSIVAGGGNDTVTGTVWDDFQRGGAGNDRLLGEAGFDDMHGNMGDDTLYGGHGYDWVVGGQGNDLLYGDGPNNFGGTGDLIFGNMGDDTLIGSFGDDLLRGGQNNDELQGGEGADFLSGDRGDDTLSGGTGRDIFHTFAGAGVDRVLDFSVAEGDRVKFEQAGTPYVLRQVGADTVIELEGTQMILVGVNASTLPVGWLISG